MSDSNTRAGTGVSDAARASGRVGRNVGGNDSDCGTEDLRVSERYTVYCFER
jgi:hypothetical protein